VNERLVIQPAWLEHVDEPGVTTIQIEPGGAFGLGDHPTTRLSALAIDALVRPTDRVLDVGCGSGVLAVIAARRGAGSVVAIDIAEAAREATVENAVRNGVEPVVNASTTPIQDVEATFDIVVANILAPVLVEIAPALRRTTAPDGHLVISGVLTGGYSHVVEALRPMKAVAEQHLDGWSAVTLVHDVR
jgi:ribosomal protein L11 methyltransferase